jgi:methenyltetrahydromethanopterin cyclohydrolase
MSKDISVNNNALKLVENALKNKEFLRIEQIKESKATIIDTGISAIGGQSAGCFVTEASMGGLAKTSISYNNYNDINLPSIFVETSYPTIATLGAQFAGWSIKKDKYFAMGSGPARALALKPKKLYDEIVYEDNSENAVILLETDKIPPSEVLEYVADECKVDLKNLYTIVAPTCSMVGSVQISGRIVETGIHKLHEVGFNVNKIIYGCGIAPIAPLHSDSAICMGRTNDALFYGGITSYVVDAENDEELMEIGSKIPSSTSRDYGKPFYETFKAAGFDFYKIDPNLFAPAVIYLNSKKSGRTYRFGKTNEEVLIKSMDIKR